MLASDVITPARLILNDVAGASWPDATVLGWLAEGERRVMQVRPDSGLTATSITLRPTETLTALSDTLTVGEDFKPALIDYVCYRAFLENSENTENAKRATAHLELFASEVGL